MRVFVMHASVCKSHVGTRTRVVCELIRILLVKRENIFVKSISSKVKLTVDGSLGWKGAIGG